MLCVLSWMLGYESAQKNNDTNADIGSNDKILY